MADIHPIQRRPHLHVWRLLGPLLMTSFLAVPLLSRAQDTTGLAVMHDWRTYFGGEGEDHVLAIATDPFGHIYVAGRTSGGLRLGNDTTGRSGLTHQRDFGGGATDAFLAKIAPKGSVLWCTYFGGAGDDEAVQVVVQGMEGIFLIGNTNSTEAIATDSAQQAQPGGGTDAFIAHFTEYGRLLNATYFGGPGEERATGGTLDARSRAVICGWAEDPGLFTHMPVPPTAPWSGGTDGFVATFSSPASFLRGRYIGGIGQDTLVQVVAVDSTGFGLLGNSSDPTGLLPADSTVLAPIGGVDAFLLLTDTLFQPVVGTAIGGSADDLGQGLALVVDGLAVCGTTWSTDLPTDTTSFQAQHGGDADGFLALYDMGLEALRTTYFGDTAFDALHAIRPDLKGRLYATGTTRSPAHIATGPAPDNILQGPSDAFILRLDSALMMEWANLVGAQGDERGTGLAVIGNTSVVIGGSSGSTEDLTWLGHQMDYGGGAWDGLTGRYRQADSTRPTGICTGTTNGSGCQGVSSPIQQMDVCLGSPVTLIIYGGALGMGAEWMWYADGCGIPEQFFTSGDTITFTAETSFMLSVRAESQHGATECTFLPIVVHDPPTPVALAADTVCAGMPMALSASGAVDYAWLLGDSTIALGAEAAWVPNLPGDHVLQVACTGPGGCVVMLDLPVHVRNAPTPHWSITDPTCAGSVDGSIVLDTLITPGVEVQWVQPPGMGAVLADVGAGSYIALVQDAFGCAHIDTLVLTAPPVLLDSVSTIAATCGEANGSAQVHGPAGVDVIYDWGGGPVTEDHLAHLPPGSYSVLVMDALGCQASTSFIIADEGSITAVIAADTLLAVDGFTVLEAWTVPLDSGATYSWSPPTGLADAHAATTSCQVQADATYVLVVTSSAGCTSSDTVLVRFITTAEPDPVPLCGEVSIPDNFSPNGDGLNDDLCALGGCFLVLSLEIHDRWGGRVFTAKDADTCWDGRANGMDVPAGPYAYSLRALRNNGDTVVRAGIIHVQR